MRAIFGTSAGFLTTCVDEHCAWRYGVKGACFPTTTATERRMNIFRKQLQECSFEFLQMTLAGPLGLSANGE